MTVVGRVAALWRYPVKSMAAEELDGAEVSWHGLAVIAGGRSSAAGRYATAFRG